MWDQTEVGVEGLLFGSSLGLQGAHISLPGLLQQNHGHKVHLVPLDDGVMGVLPAPEDSTLLAVVRRCEQALSSMNGLGAFELEGGAAPWFNIIAAAAGEVHSSDLDVLRALEVVRTAEDAFGDSEVTLVCSPLLELQWTVSLSSPTSFLHMPLLDLTKFTKMEGMAQLIRSGWKERVAVRPGVCV